MFINFKAPREVPLPVQCSVLFRWQWPGSRLPPGVPRGAQALSNNSGSGQWGMGIHTVQFHNIILYEA